MKKILFFSFIFSTLVLFGTENKKIDISITKNEKSTNVRSNAKISDVEHIRLKFKEFITKNPEGIVLKKLTEEEAEEQLRLLDKKVEDLLLKLDINSNEYVFSHLKNLKNEAVLRTNFLEIVNMCKAYEFLGSKYYKNSELKERIIKALTILNKNYYYVGGKETGNWWQWEIGIPKAINEIFVIMGNELPQELKMKLLNASSYFQPDARYSGASEGAKYSTTTEKRLSTGGNRADTVHISFLRSVLLNDEQGIKDATSAMSPLFEYVNEGEGFYDDGSFIQHGSVAYNGTYGTVLLSGLSQVIYLSGGTKFEIKNEKISNIYESIVNGYNYLLINGGMNDSVSGRAISNDTDLERAVNFLQAIALISEGADKEDKGKIQSLIKRVLIENNSYNIPEKVKNIVTRAILVNILKDKKIKAEKLVGSKIFSNMDRAVQFGNKGGKVLISMHSNRVANYETMLNENVKGWHTGDGMTYIYGNDSKTFNEYWPTVDMLMLPGTTESDKERELKSGERRAIPALNTWVGGASNGKYSFIGMDFISHNDKTKAKKSWLMLGDEVIAIASNITSEDGKIVTTIDNRILNHNKKVFVNGLEVFETQSIPSVKGTCIIFKDEYLNETIGYKFIDIQNAQVSFESRIGSYKDIGGKSKEKIEKQYFKLSINHGQNPQNMKYAYTILPMFNDYEIEDYNLENINIQQLDENIHIVRIKNKNLLAINMWNDEASLSTDGMHIKGHLSVLKVNKKDGIELTLSNPTHLMPNTKVILEGKYKLSKANENVKIYSEDNKTILEVYLGTNGKSVVLNLRKEM
ncbi:polysaccharide lyase 8 family protein [Caviibacter abscessus]|uniref:polysaccharide lyase 8 family protein n=1 Tax=Caviibacter abscessus TaxID=1766719 RepID=UPI00082D826E|nr:polysaccharide lyase 8 family protein [Caviibacter abscessus]